MRKDIHKVLVIGSGPIVIGQAAEFDYAGTQACLSLKEEGCEVVLINSNPATIMTDTDLADRVYVEPLTKEFVTSVIATERPDGLLATLGGQTGLNLAMELAEAGILEQYGVTLLGTHLDAIRKAEDRELFKEAMQHIGQPVPESRICHTVDEALAFAETIGYPLIIRPAFTLGGTGGGVVHNDAEMREIGQRGLVLSPIHQILVERSVAGWKEIEYEVMRDSEDNCIIICNMENIDPVGVHTGDSIVVAPSQTLTDGQAQMLRTASLDIIRYLKIEGGCNVQYALDTESNRYYVIEVNPRMSRSSALASKATGYPIAKVAAKVALGLSLGEITNAVTGKTKAAFEPALDYVVIKIPRWPFEKFNLADRELGTQMKATGEVMALATNLPAGLQKAVRSLETGTDALYLPKLEHLSHYDIKMLLRRVDDERLFVIAEALRRGFEPEEIARVTKIDIFFIAQIARIIDCERWLMNGGLTADAVREAKYLGFSDRRMAALAGTDEAAVRAVREQEGIEPSYRMVDTCAGEFAAASPYYYSAYGVADEVSPQRHSVMVLGAGPIRIGQGVEFDYCSVQAIRSLRKYGYRSIMINNNPETVSTDFDMSDALYFEPLTAEDVQAVIAKERPEGVIAQFGGQTAINLGAQLADTDVPMWGTDMDGVDLAEDRKRFDALLAQLGIARPRGCMVTGMAEAERATSELHYPLMVRPSYVLGGRAMQIVYHPRELTAYLREAVIASSDHPVLIDEYVVGQELEVDALCDGTDVFIPGIMEQIERAGVHSGDSFAVFPPQHVSEDMTAKIVDCTERIAKALRVRGIVNIQYIVADDKLYVIEVNPRSSRTVPFMSKVTGYNLVALATGICVGKTLREMGITPGLAPVPSHVAVKAPVFSFAKLGLVEIALGPEMKSTGEVMGIGASYSGALYRAVVGAHMRIPDGGSVLITVSDRDKEEAAQLAKEFIKHGYRIMATEGTGQYLQEAGVEVDIVNKMHEGGDRTCATVLREGQVDMVVNTITYGKRPEREGFRLRRLAVELGIPCLTSLDTTREVVHVLQNRKKQDLPEVKALQDYHQEG